MTLNAFDVRPTCDTADVHAIPPFPPNPPKQVLCDVPDCGVDALSQFWLCLCKWWDVNIVLDETPQEELTHCQVWWPGWPGAEGVVCGRCTTNPSCNFGGYRYGTKVTLHGRQSEFSAVFRFVFKSLSRNITHHNSHKRCLSDIHGCNQSITKGTLLGEQSLNLHLRITNFPQTLRLTHLTHVLQTKWVWLRRSNNERHFIWGTN